MICESIKVRAPIERCFALSTRIELVQRTLGMKLFGGVTSGHIAADSRVIWRGWKFGLPTEHHTLITGFAAPHLVEARGEGSTSLTGRAVAWFQDSQERGRFAFFQHDHFFRESTAEADPETLLEDHIHFALPFGTLGCLIATLIVGPHIRKLACQRFALIKEIAEGEGWREWLENPPA